MARAPLDADATRGAHFKRIAGSGTFVVAVAALGTAAFIWGAAKGQVAVMGGGPPAVLAAALVLAFIVADRRAETEFFSGFAQQRGLLYYDEGALMELTPLLGAGDRRHCEHMMEGDFRDVHVRLTHFIYEIKHESESTSGTARNVRWEKRHFTVCVVDMEDALMLFKGFFLRTRRGMFDKLENDEWLSRRGLPRVELESIAFNERYELFRDRAMDENLLRQLFSPSLVQWLSQHPLAPGVEFKAGTLVVFLEECVEEAGKLDWLLEAAVELCSRVSREAAEALPETR